MTAELALGFFAVAAGLAAALVEHRRWRDDAAVRERVTALEHRCTTLEERLTWTQRALDRTKKRVKRLHSPRRA